LKKIQKRVREYRNKLSELKFLDPASGSGNFLTETYISLRRLENEALALLEKTPGAQAQIREGFKCVSISQFYGIEINDFAVAVAQTALWIAESQMNKETESVVKFDIDSLPLKSATNIHEANALRISWNGVAPRGEVNYIMGNPPFVGARIMSKEQKDDLFEVFGEKWKGAGNLDYVACWYKKAADYMAGTGIRAALVSSNSITQGEQPAILWKPLFKLGLHIDFAYRTFRWDSEAKSKAHVHCVIVGFSLTPNPKPKVIYDPLPERAKNINGYLVDAVDAFVESRRIPLCDVTGMDFGSMPNDGGFLSRYSSETKKEIVSKFPDCEKFFRRLLGADEFINNIERWCLWLPDASPSEIKKYPPIYSAVENVRHLRLNSPRKGTQELAKFPHLFGEIRQPKTRYLLVPSTSSERRLYVPIGFLEPDVISNNANLLIPNATIYHFSVLTSSVHMAWMRAVAGRLKSDYRYSAKIVYNNFPWPEPTEEQRLKIEETAQAILDVRAKYPDSSFADLYDEVTMPPDLRGAHQKNDREVMKAYGFKPSLTEPEIVARLLDLYQSLTANQPLLPEKKSKRSKK
ncbi:MAG: class I SAM-dependent DNA methyltransferase, partial [Thermoguttaceae bacterium]|nr:class I SAM-dependent DNA methyltransferase [Thermoguttaceae bacterium]